MKELEQVLDWYSANALKAIAAARGVNPQASKPQLVRELAKILWDPKAIESVLGTLTPAQQAGLQRAKQYGGTRLQPDLLQAQIEADGFKDAEKAVNSLMRLGFLVYEAGGSARWELWPQQNTYGYYYQNPTLRLAPPVLERVELPPELGRRPMEPWTAPLDATLDHPFSALQRDLYHFVQYLRANKVKLLKSGMLGKRDFARINQQLSTPEELKEITSFEETFRLQFLGLLLQYAKLTEVAEGELRATAAAQRFFTLPDPEQVRVLIEAWLQLAEWNEFWLIPWIDPESAYGGSDAPTWDRLPPARKEILNLLDRERPRDGWFTVPSLVASMQRHKLGFLIPNRAKQSLYHYYGFGASAKEQPPLYMGFRPRGARRGEYFSKTEHWHLVEGGFITMVLRWPLWWLGIVRLGVQEEKLVAFQVTEIGAAALGWTDASAWVSQAPARSLIVQPNFEIVALLEGAGFALLTELDRFAERVNLDKAALYRLTRDSVYRGLQSGLTREQIEAMLRERSGMPLPQNIAFTLREWEELFNRIRIEKRVTLLEAETEGELDKRLADLQIVPIRRIGPTAALIDAAAAKKVTDWGKGPNRRVAVHDYTQTTADTFRFVDGREIEIRAGFRSPLLEHRLARLAVPMKNGRFLLDPERVRAASAELGAEGILRFLEEGSNQVLSADTQLTIEGWAGKFPSLALGKLVALTAPRAEAMDAVMKVPELARHVQRLTPTVALIPEKGAPELRKALEGRGIPLREVGEVDLALARSTDSEEVSLLFVKPKRRREIIEQAITMGRKLLVGYPTWNNTRIIIHEVDPIQVMESTGQGTLVAYSHRDRVQEHFTIQQIQGIRMLEKPVEGKVKK